MSIVRLWIFIAILSVILWLVLKISRKSVAFHWVFLWVMLASGLAIAILWGLAHFLGGAFPLF